MKLYFKHFRSVEPGTVIEVEPQGGISFRPDHKNSRVNNHAPSATVAVDPATYTAAIAVCSAREPFSKKEGRDWAADRLNYYRSPGDPEHPRIIIPAIDRLSPERIILNTALSWVLTLPEFHNKFLQIVPVGGRTARQQADLRAIRENNRLARQEYHAARVARSAARKNFLPTPNKISLTES